MGRLTVLVLGLGFAASCALTEPYSPPPELELIDGGSSQDRSLQPGGEIGAPASPDAGPVPGTSCKEIDHCQMGCADQACKEGCLHKGSAEAQAQWNALELCVASAAKAACSSATGSVALWNACLGSACPSQFSACFQTVAGGSGAATCFQIIWCVNACDKTDSVCLAECVWRGTAAAQAAYGAWSKCSAAAKASSCQAYCATGGQSCSECLSYYCPSSAASCKSS